MKIFETFTCSRTGEQEGSSKENSPKGQTKAPARIQGERQSARQKEKDLKEEKDFPLENIDWEKLTPEDRERMKERHEHKELEFMDSVQRLQHGTAIYPLGRDRTYRRYWLFRSVPGIFVEDQEEHISNRCLEPVPQTTAQQFKSDQLPLKQADKQEDKSGLEEKSTSSDKENESFDQNKMADDNAMEVDGNTEPKPTILQENNISIEHQVDSQQEPIKQVVTQPEKNLYESVHDQISNRNGVRWAYYSTPMELDRLINSLNSRGFREGPLRQCLLDQKRMIESKLDLCPVDILSIDETDEAKKDLACQKVKIKNKRVQGQVKGMAASEFLELNLREQLSDLEERIFGGGLGQMKVMDRVHISENKTNFF